MLQYAKLITRTYNLHRQKQWQQGVTPKKFLTQKLLSDHIGEFILTF